MHAVRPRSGVDGWAERSDVLGGFATRWLEREMPSEPGTFEQVFLEAPLVERATNQAAVMRQARVRLSASARETILHRACWQSGVDGLETGGWLFGDTSSGVVVAHATGPGPTAIRERHALTHDHSALPAYRLRRLWGDVHANRIGQWHSHPGGSGSPSEVDLRGWRSRPWETAAEPL